MNMLQRMACDVLHCAQTGDAASTKAKEDQTR